MPSNSYYGVATSLRRPQFICNLETCITRIRGLPKIVAPFKGEHLEWTHISLLALIAPKASP